MLQWLFQANLKDGTFIQQDHSDLSQTTPGKNAFYDVLQRIQDVESFGLFSEDFPYVYAVDLRDGHFEVNGIPFFAHEPTLDLTLSPLRLIYYRTERRHFSTGGNELASETFYNFGWQTTIDGKNHQQTIQVRPIH